MTIEPEPAEDEFAPVIGTINALAIDNGEDGEDQPPPDEDLLDLANDVLNFLPEEDPAQDFP